MIDKIELMQNTIKLQDMLKRDGGITKNDVIYTLFNSSIQEMFIREEIEIELENRMINVGDIDNELTISINDIRIQREINALVSQLSGQNFLIQDLIETIESGVENIIERYGE